MWLGIYLSKPPHGPRLEPKVIWSERYFSSNNIHKSNSKKRDRERERERGVRFNVFYTMYNRKNETIDCLEDVVFGT